MTKKVKDVQEAWDYLFDLSEYITDEAIDRISCAIDSIRMIMINELPPNRKLGPKAERKLRQVEKMLRQEKIWKKSILE